METNLYVNILMVTMLRNTVELKSSNLLTHCRKQWWVNKFVSCFNCDSLLFEWLYSTGWGDRVMNLKGRDFDPFYWNANYCLVYLENQEMRKISTRIAVFRTVNQICNFQIWSRSASKLNTAFLCCVKYFVRNIPSI